MKNVSEKESKVVEHWTDEAIYKLLRTCMSDNVEKENLTYNEKCQLEIYWNILYHYIFSDFVTPKYWKLTTKKMLSMMKYIEKITGLKGLTSDELKKLKTA